MTVAEIEASESKGLGPLHGDGGDQPGVTGCVAKAAEKNVGECKTAPLFKFAEAAKTKVKFLSVGLLNTVVGYSLFAVLIFLNVPYLAALLVATVAGVTFNYFSIGQLVFRSKGGLAVFGKFVASYGVVYLTNSAGLVILVNFLHLVPYLGQAICVPPSIVMSWVLMNNWVYKK